MEPLRSYDPTRLGRYELLGRLGAGGMGTVYQGRTPGGRLVAVKVVHADLARDPDFRRRFAQEVEAARRVGGHHTAGVVDADPEADPQWLVTSYLEGRSLARVLDEDGPLELDGLRRLAAGLAEALEAIHALGLVHRDLKPSNVLMTDDGPRVIDFGIARALDGTTITRTGVVLGTPGFMAPEQIEGKAVGPACDIFCLGQVLCHASGVRPFGEATAQVMLFRILNQQPDLHAMPPGQMRDLAAACLAKDPAARPTATEVLRLLGGPVETVVAQTVTAVETGSAAPTVAADSPVADAAAAVAASMPTFQAPAVSTRPTPTVIVPPSEAAAGPGEQPASVPLPVTDTTALLTHSAGTVADAGRALPAAAVPAAAGGARNAIPRSRRRPASAIALSALTAAVAAIAWTAARASHDSGAHDNSPPLAASSGSRASSEASGTTPTRTSSSRSGTDPTAIAMLPAAIRSKGVLVVAADSTYPPMKSIDGSGKMVGFDVDLGNAVAMRLGLTASFRKEDFGNILDGIHAGTYDMGMSGISDTKDREKQGFDFVDYFNSGTKVMVASGNPEGITSTNPTDLSLCGKTVGVQSGTLADSDIPARNTACQAAGKPGIVKIDQPSQSDVNASLQSGRVDAVLADSSVVDNAAKTSGFTAVGNAYQTGPYGIAIWKATNDHLAKAVLQVLKDLQADGTYATIATKWGIESGDLPTSGVVINGATS